VARTAPESGAHGRIADGGSRNRASKGVCPGQRHRPRAGAPGCKTAGSAYASSSPAPATTSENGSWPAVTTACGPFAHCLALVHDVPSRGVVSQWLRTWTCGGGHGRCRHRGRWSSSASGRHSGSAKRGSASTHSSSSTLRARASGYGQQATAERAPQGSQLTALQSDHSAQIADSARLADSRVAVFG
jgi:hypothetical protein